MDKADNDDAESIEEQPLDIGEHYLVRRNSDDWHHDPRLDVCRNGSDDGRLGKGARSNHQSQIYRSYQHRPVRNRYLVLQSVPRRVWKSFKTVHMRILPQVLEIRIGLLRSY
ncbi:unnamed protein product, partial [Nesidiocoris tenuis]